MEPHLATLAMTTSINMQIETARVSRECGPACIPEDYDWLAVKWVVSVRLEHGVLGRSTDCCTSSCISKARLVVA